MRLSRKQRTAIQLVIIGISVLAWIVLLFNPGHIMTMEHCHISASGPSAASLSMLLQMNPLSSQMLGWGLMVVAMMLPKLIVSVQMIYLQSFRNLRFVCALLFVSGYLMAWMLAGIPLIGVIIAANLFFPLSYIPALIVFAVAVVWQFSPLKQRCLNAGHNHPVLPAFGWNAMRSALQYGAVHGAWCIGSGWALMLFPMLLPQGHNLAMLIITFVMLSEHWEHPVFPQWRYSLRLRLLRIIIAQAKLKLMGVVC
ncbi:MAG: DUF2182 domain-containing protein [Bacteroidetes bacterium]|nr:DUF2182 domain-containing protein [Bacteroidota bacterium]